MKTIVNVYKDEALWAKPGPGIGDYLRGCCYLAHKSQTSPPGRGFQVRVNLDLSPAGQHLDYPKLHHKADARLLAAAPEFFYEPRDGSVELLIDEFLGSQRDTLFVSTNRSWRGLDDMLPPAALRYAADILRFVPAFEASLSARFAELPRPYTVFHIRDYNGADADSFLGRVEEFVRAIVQKQAGYPVICVSNNPRIRDHMCRRNGYIDLKMPVGNHGGQGVLSETELIEMALIRNAGGLISLSRYDWNSGFAVWTSRIFGVPALLFNAHYEFERVAARR